MAKKAKKTRSRSNNPNGRPKEYQEEMRTLSVTIPERIVNQLDNLADELGCSRQKLLIEWLSVASLLEIYQFLWSGSAGTTFEQFPTRPPKIVNTTRKTLTNKEMLKWVTLAAESDPDEHVSGTNIRCKRDQIETKSQIQYTGLAVNMLPQ